MAEVDPMDLAYAAGLIDGEAMVSIIEYTERPSPSRPGRPVTMRQRGVVVVAMTDPAIPLWLRDTFGGSIQALPARSRRHKDQTRWTVAGKAAGKLCALLAPYLKLKAPQARLVAELYTRRADWRSKGVPADELATRRRDIETIRGLNARGALGGQ